MDEITLEILNPLSFSEQSQITNPSSQVFFWWHARNGIHFEFFIDHENDKLCLRIRTIDVIKYDLHVTMRQVCSDGKEIILDKEEINLRSLLVENEFFDIKKDYINEFENGVDFKLICNIKFNPIEKVISSSFTKSILENIKKIKDDEKFLDFTMKFKNGKELKALKFILASKSPVFRKMILSNMLESQRNEVFIPDIDYEVMLLVVNFMYNGATEGIDYHIFDVLVAADKYAILDLKEFCEVEISKGLTIRILADVLFFADRYSAALLKKRCIQYIHSNTLCLMCLQHPCYENLNKFAASKPARIIYGALLVMVVAFGCYRLLQASNDLHASKNAKLVVIPETENNLISFDVTSRESVEKMTSKIDKVYDSYQKLMQDSRDLVECNDDYNPPSEKSCRVDWREFGPCSKENYYGYNRASPCVFIKYRKIRDWTPKYLNSSDLPENMPEHLRDYILNDRHRNQRALWVSCEGENPIDIENLGPITYYPNYGFPSYYFPWKGQEGYMEPMIAINIERPKTGVVLFIKCTMWTQDSQESTKFAILIE